MGMVRRAGFVSVFALLVLSAGGMAQDAAPTATPAVAPAEPASPAPPVSTATNGAPSSLADCRRARAKAGARVTAAYVETDRKPAEGDGDETARRAASAPRCGEPPPAVEAEAQLRDTLTVVVSGLDELIAEARCRQQVLGADVPEPVVLFLDDRPLLDIVEYPPTDPGTCRLRFPLRRSEKSRDVWTHLLGRPGLAPSLVRVSVGFAEGYPLPSDPKATIALRVIPVGWFVGWSALFLLLLVGFVLLARRSNLLRDSGVSPSGEARRPYSLASTQACWWFFLTLAAYLLIGMVTGDFSTSINATVLSLMGISAGTAVGSSFVDAAKARPGEVRRQETMARALRLDLATLETRLAAAEGTLRAAPADATATAEVARLTAEREERLSQLRKLDNESEHFLLDILSDANGVNFHRFQMAAWTVVLGIIFVGHVYKELAMPEFSQTLLLLMGLSAGTYIGLKIPEPVVPGDPPAGGGGAAPPGGGGAAPPGAAT